MKKLSEAAALALLQRAKTAYQSHIKVNYERAARDCRACPTQGICCTDAHFVNVHITRLEAIAIRDTLTRTPRLNDQQRRDVYERAKETVARYDLRLSADTFRQTYSCPLFEPGLGCLVHRRAKPAPCIQHACYDLWEDVPPASLQWQSEHHVEDLNNRTYGSAWAWLPVPLWLTLVDPEADGSELQRLISYWSMKEPRRDVRRESNAAYRIRRAGSVAAYRQARSLPVIK